MADALLPDALWDLVEPFLPIPPRRPQGGRPRVSDRACLTGIVFVLRSGIPWQMLPQELGCGSGMTCWRRLRDWQRGGVWDLILARVRADLPAVPAQDVDGRLISTPSFPALGRQKDAVLLVEIASLRLLGGLWGAGSGHRSTLGR